MLRKSTWLLHLNDDKNPHAGRDNNLVALLTWNKDGRQELTGLAIRPKSTKSPTMNPNAPVYITPSFEPWVVVH